MALKSSDKPQFSKKWWTSEKPAEVKGVDLEKALASLEKALADEKKDSNEDTIDACLHWLEELEAAVDKTIKKELDKKKHKDVITVLEKFDNLIEDERDRLEEALEDEGEEEEGEEEDEGKLFEPDYLIKMIKIMRSSGKTLNFGFGINTNAPEQSDLLLKRKGKPEMLFKALKKTGKYSNRTMVCGTALPDPENGKVLMMNVEEGDEPPQILKLGRKFLRGNKELKFRKLKVVIGGKTLVDNDPDEEEGGAAAPGGGADLSKELAKVQQLSAGWKTTLDEISNQIGRLREALNKQDDPELRGVGAALGKIMDQFPDLDLSKLAAAAKANDRAAYDKTLTQTSKEIKDVHKLLSQGPLLSTIDENPFVPTKVHSTVDTFLSRLSSELGIAV